VRTGCPYHLRTDELRCLPVASTQQLCCGVAGARPHGLHELCSYHTQTNELYAVPVARTGQQTCERHAYIACTLGSCLHRPHCLHSGLHADRRMRAGLQELELVGSNRCLPTAARTLSAATQLSSLVLDGGSPASLALSQGFVAQVLQPLGRLRKLHLCNAGLTDLPAISLAGARWEGMHAVFSCPPAGLPAWPARWPATGRQHGCWHMPIGTMVIARIHRAAALWYCTAHIEWR